MDPTTTMVASSSPSDRRKSTFGSPINVSFLQLESQVIRESRPAGHTFADGAQYFFPFLTYQRQAGGPYIFAANACLDFSQFDILYQFGMNVQLQHRHEPAIDSQGLFYPSGFNQTIDSHGLGGRRTYPDSHPTTRAHHQRFPIAATSLAKHL